MSNLHSFVSISKSTCVIKFYFMLLIELCNFIDNQEVIIHVVLVFKCPLESLKPGFHIS